LSTRKELKKAYREMQNRMGVFRIRNTVNGKMLIDSSTDIDAKWNRHRWLLKYEHHTNKSLQQDWNEFGADHFVFEILSEIEPDENKLTDTRKELEVLEDMVLEELQIDPALRYGK